jgi:hypothetical protein
MVIDSIKYAQITERRSRIPEAHANTSRWMLDENNFLRPDWTNFASWCQIQSPSGRIYWITGKPGSGKSTLMRFIKDEDDTKACLRRWAGDRAVMTAACFFWISGTDIQKSQAGMLRSLLYGLLQQCPEISCTVSPWRWRSHETGLRKLDKWALDELVDGFRNLIKSLQASACICLFIDGLDEFDGNDDSRNAVISLFKEIATYPHVKICVSSRPWLIFQDAF